MIIHRSLYKVDVNILQNCVVETVNYLLENIRHSRSGYYWESIYRTTELELRSKANVGIFMGVSGNILYLLSQNNRSYDQYIIGATDWLCNIASKTRFQDISFATGCLGVIWTLLKVSEKFNVDSYSLCANRIYENHKCDFSLLQVDYEPIEHYILSLYLWKNGGTTAIRSIVESHFNQVCREWELKKRKLLSISYLVDLRYCLLLHEDYCNSLTSTVIVAEVEEALRNADRFNRVFSTNATLLKISKLTARYFALNSNSKYDFDIVFSYTPFLDNHLIAKSWHIMSLFETRKVVSAFNISQSLGEMVSHLPTKAISNVIVKSPKKPTSITNRIPFGEEVTDLDEGRVLTLRQSIDITFTTIYQNLIIVNNKNILGKLGFDRAVVKMRNDYSLKEVKNKFVQEKSTFFLVALSSTDRFITSTRINSFNFQILNCVKLYGGTCGSHFLTETMKIVYPDHTDVSKKNSRRRVVKNQLIQLAKHGFLILESENQK